MQFKRIIAKISISSDENDNFDHGIIELSAEKITRIKHLAILAATENITKLSSLDYSVKTMKSDYEALKSDNGKQPLEEPKDGRVECPFLHVEDDCFYWTGLVGKSDIRWSMHTIPLAVLDEPGDYDMRDDYPDEEEEPLDKSEEAGGEEPTAESILKEILDRFPEADPDSDLYDTGIDGDVAVDFLVEIVPKIRMFLSNQAARDNRTLSALKATWDFIRYVTFDDPEHSEKYFALRSKVNEVIFDKEFQESTL